MATSNRNPPVQPLFRSLLPVLAIVYCVLALCDVLNAQQTILRRLDGSAISPQNIDAIVMSEMRSAHVEGTGIALFNEGKIAYLKAYGFRDKATLSPLTPDSVMTAASLTKAAFATMVMQLVEKRIIDLDQPVWQYLPKPLPEYPNYTDLANEPRYRLITMRMLLDHSSGFPNWRRFTDDKKLSVFFAPGSRFAYSGEGIALAQMVVETVTKKSVNVLMQEYVFKPVGMRRTSMVWDERFEKNYANGYDDQGKSLGPERRTKADAAGGMQTTLRDQARFALAVLNGAIPDAKVWKTMLSPQIRIFTKTEFPSLTTQTTTANDAIRLSYGLGWGLFFTPYGEAFFKEGHDLGWRHYVVGFTGPRSGMLIMTNSDNGEDMYSSLLEKLAGDTFTPLEWEGFKAPAISDLSAP
jgi:CubicO group peptidase (beta-lactamase class C family)